ncbi:MAG TPA: hypothetical protein PLE99_11225 [Candidatus Thiothrix moscowensis]|uniref:hypothetical protein n=1 Tax=unclassified Thiothrix TaxID=2636184 RepID=UPI0025D317F2|nr:MULTISPECIES: hypothetical protein [unclassified Thiothrix]HRJ53331.1 hypothetical protein [Candidatus Thiothrix moscowensis]HRJ94170.1 hypothetical protein [Candidatus Thiothrix moscowensis]
MIDDLEHYYTSVYDEAARYSSFRKWLFKIMLLFLVVSVFVNGYLLYIIMTALFFCQISISYLKSQVDRLYMLGHNLQKHSMLGNTMPDSIDVEDVANLKSQVSLGVVDAVKKKIEQQQDSVTYFKEDSYSGLEKLRWMIHENSFKNSHFYNYSYAENMRMFVVAIVILIFSLLILMPYIKDDPSLTIPKLAFTILSIGLIYEFFEETMKTKKTVDLMKGVDEFLSKNTSADSQIIIDVFSRYNEAKLITPNIPFSIYNKHGDRIASLWKQKMA